MNKEKTSQGYATFGYTVSAPKSTKKDAPGSDISKNGKDMRSKGKK